jgi:predicted NBD/HSP70 family sugar kinase
VSASRCPEPAHPGHYSGPDALSPQTTARRKASDVQRRKRSPSRGLLKLATPAAVDIFTQVLTRGPIGRIEVARNTGLSQAAVTKKIGPLLEAGFVREREAVQASLNAGRPILPLTVVPESLFAIGIKVNPDEVIGVLTTLTAQPRKIVHRAVGRPDVEGVVSVVIEVATQLRDTLGLDAARLAGIGVTVSGDIDTEGGMVRDSPRLGWSGVPLRDLLTSRLDIPVLVDNDTRALVIAEEWFGIGLDAESFVIITIGTGIGSGLYLNGEVVEGVYGVAGEIGHIPIAPQEFVCTCGRHGCLEAVSSTGAILTAARTRTRNPRLTFREAAALARRGERDIGELFARAGYYIGAALAALVNLVGPELVLIASDALAEYDLYDASLRETFATHAFGAAINCKIVTRSQSFDDWARGGAASLIRAAVQQRLG